MKIVSGLRIRWRCLVCGTSGRKISRASVWSHQNRWLVAPESSMGSAARYVIISIKISAAMMPDSGATLPSQIGRST